MDNKTPTEWRDPKWVLDAIKWLPNESLESLKTYWFKRWNFETGNDEDRHVYDVIARATNDPTSFLRQGKGEPTDVADTGDLYYNTSICKMYVFNAIDWVMMPELPDEI